MGLCEKTSRTRSNHGPRSVCKIKTLNFDCVHLYTDGIRTRTVVNFTLFGKIMANATSASGLG